MSTDMPKTKAETDNATFWSDIAAMARTTSTPANTEDEAHYLNERHDRARKAEKLWRGDTTPETIGSAWDAAIALNAETCSAYCDAAGERPCEQQIRAAGERVNALLAEQAARLAQ